ncbi:E set domain-containing protein [Ramicandelaber brevisporus]|nr:E set domain-containing protein [Ramicandelaber brevisporus]
MSAQHYTAADDEDLQASQTAGYVVTEKKTIDEYENLDKDDPAIRKWKESLGLGAAKAAVNTGLPSVQVLSLVISVAGRPDLILDVSTPEAVARLATKPVVIKEGVDYKRKLVFRINNEIVTGLKYLHNVKRAGVRVDKIEEVVGSYGPNPQPYTKEFVIEEAPSGFIARGKYEITSKFVDDDNKTHLKWTWTLEIKKDW